MESMDVNDVLLKVVRSFIWQNADCLRLDAAGVCSSEQCPDL